jgi:uncharacterized protein (TIGR02246 family)
MKVLPSRIGRVLHGQMAKALVGLAALLIFAFPLRAQGCSTTAADSIAARNAIEAVWTEAIALFKNGEWERVAELFAENGVYVPPGGPDAAGREALRALFAGNKGLRLVNLTRDVTHFILCGDVVLEGATSTEEWRTIGQPRTQKSELRYLYVFKRQPGGRWLVQYLMETAPPPMPKKAP